MNAASKLIVGHIIATVAFIIAELLTAVIAMTMFKKKWKMIIQAK